MAVTWDQLAEEDFTQAAGPVTIARLDCIKYPDICRANGVNASVTLYLKYLQFEQMNRPACSY